MVIFRSYVSHNQMVNHNKTHHFQALNRLGLPWPPMGSMGCRPWQRSVPVASRDWVASVDLWSFGLHLRFSSGNLWLDLSGSVSLAHPNADNAEARCPVHVSRYRGIAHLSGGDYGKTTRSSHFTKGAVQKFGAPLIHVLTCFYMFLLTFSVIYIRAEVHHLSGPLPFSPALWHFWVYLSGASDLEKRA